MRLQRFEKSSGPCCCRCPIRSHSFGREKLKSMDALQTYCQMHVQLGLPVGIQQSGPPRSDERSMPSRRESCCSWSGSNSPSFRVDRIDVCRILELPNCPDRNYGGQVREPHPLTSELHDSEAPVELDLEDSQFPTSRQTGSRS